MSDTGAARVCVDSCKRCGAESDERSESQEGAATPPLGRGLRPRLYRLTTTTYYTLVLYCSSSRRKSNLKITYDSGGRHV